jgi:hypothetical protein
MKQTARKPLLMRLSLKKFIVEEFYAEGKLEWHLEGKLREL